jgi:hypothetical protein
MISTVSTPVSNQCASDADATALAASANDTTSTPSEISQNTTPGTRVNTSSSRIRPSKLDSRRASIAREAGIAAIGVAIGWCDSNTLGIGNKLFSATVAATTWIGTRFGAFVTSLGTFATAHPLAAGGCAVGYCALLGAARYCLQKFAARGRHTPANARTPHWHSHRIAANIAARRAQTFVSSESESES